MRHSFGTLRGFINTVAAVAEVKSFPGLFSALECRWTCEINQMNQNGRRLD